MGGNFSMIAGGKGANQAVAVARLGGKLSFVGKLGDDLFGKASRKALEKEGIDISYLFEAKHTPSGVALILVNGEGENCISVAAGANGQLMQADILKAHDHIASASYILLQLEIPIPTVEFILRTYGPLSPRLILNPAPASFISKDLLAHIFMITPNETEASYLTGTKVIDVPTAKKAAHQLRDMGIPNVIITLGENGAYVLSEELEELIPAEKVEVVDTTAAGDTFNGALAVALSEGMKLRESVLFAHKAAAMTVGSLGAQDSIPFRVEIE